MTIAIEELKTEEFSGFIRNMVRTELVNLTHELPKHTFEALLLQQIFDKLNSHDRMFAELKQETNEQFEKVFDKLDSHDKMFVELKQEMDQRFEQVDQRFEQVDQRFGQVDQRFEQVDQRFDRIDEQFGEVRQSFSDLKSWVGTIVGGFQNRAGRKLEDMVAGTLRLALNRKDIDPSSIRLRQKIKDKDGVIGLKGRGYEIDILADGDSLLAFEIKSACDLEMAERFADKVALIKHLYPTSKVSGALISLESDPKVIGYCRKHDIAVVS